MIDKYSFNSKFITKNDKPWFPIMGEFHYSRFPNKYWEESLFKIKSGGVEVVSTYVIWIHHEEIEEQYDFSGDRDLKLFIETCKKVGLKVFLRIGPWSHGEVRNGGFPDWILKKPYEERTNDEDYLCDVKRFYQNTFNQVQGLFLKDGGPIIGIQIENEYGHCGGLQGEQGNIHIRKLTTIAKEIGYDVPLWTATGWGGAMTGDLIPVMGGYCEAPWDQRTTEIEPSVNYLFTHERNDHNIGSDLGFGAGITFDIEKYPYLTAELGGGLQVTHHRRPMVSSTDIGAMSLAKLGSGVNLLGYYVYHGGTNPKGKLSTLQESRATGYLNDLPELSYDFMAPIREYGQISEIYKEIKLLAMFLNDFGDELCKMPAIIPDNNPQVATNLTDLRISFRYLNNSGYVFINNYQRRQTMSEHNDFTVQIPLENEIINFPCVDIKDKDYFFYPFNMKLKNSMIKTATATPLCKIENNENTAYFFYTDNKPQFEVINKSDKDKIIVISKDDALNSWKLLNGKHLIISNSTIIETNEGVSILAFDDIIIKVFPPLKSIPNGFIFQGNCNEFSVYNYKIIKKTGNVTSELMDENSEKSLYKILIEVDNDVNDWFLNINYNGNSARIYIDNELVADNFWTGETWQIGLKRFNFPKEISLEISPLFSTDKVFLENTIKMINEKACSLDSISIIAEYQNLFKF